MSCDRADEVRDLALVWSSDERTRALEDHLVECADCRAEVEMWRALVARLDADAVAIVRPTGSLWSRLAQRLEIEAEDVVESRTEPRWRTAAPGVDYAILAVDAERATVAMLVRLAPDTAYPPHTHEGVEELHLLDGELWIDERLLRPGDYNRAERGSADARVWSETGCTCVLITSLGDRLG